MSDIRKQLVIGQRIEVNTANGWTPGVITKVLPSLKRGGFPRTLVKYDDDPEWPAGIGPECWTGQRGIRII